MLDLQDLQLIRALDISGSLAAAARALNVTPPAISLRLKRMEHRLGVHLVLRGSRGSLFTDEGIRLRDEAVALLGRLESVPEVVANSAAALAGTLRIVAPLGFGRRHVAPIVRSFRTRHPGVVTSLTLAESPLAQAAGMDLIVHIGTVKDSSWVRHHLAPNDRYVCASPDYIRRHGGLTHPSALADADCLCLRENDEDLALWRFMPERAQPDSAKARRNVHVKVKPALSSNDGEVICQWALDGMGYMVRSEWETSALLEQGRLQRVLTDWHLEEAPVLALVPSRSASSARLRLFLNHAKKALKPTPWRH
ncbi:MAG TPA: LysR family transcriptional regulator [Rhizobacter sp.]|nr:LysR family transcriptional regulator [Rhizobacter sp.]